MLLRAGKCPEHPDGRPLGAIARELRLEIEGQLGRRQAEIGTVPAADLALGYQAAGLLLQLEGVDRQMRALHEPIDAGRGPARLSVLRR